MCWGIKLSSTVSVIIHAKPTHHIVSFIDCKALTPMDCSDLSRVVTYLHILAAFAVILRFLLEDVPIPADMIREMVMQTIKDSDLPPLTGKRRRVQSQEQCNPPKRAYIKYDYKRAEESVFTDWVGAVPHFWVTSWV